MILYTDSLSIEQVFDFFTNHSESTRIKKLIYYTVNNQWENEVSFLDPSAFKSLIVELKNGYPTIANLNDALFKAVSTLNRPDIYGNIAEIIVKKCKKLYEPSDSSEEETLGKLVVKPNFGVPNLDFIVNKLESNIESERIKKLIFYVSRKYWEHDINIIEQISLKVLIEDLKKQFPTLATFKKQLFATVESLNRTALYYGIAVNIIQELQLFYEPDAKTTLLVSPDPPLPFQQITNQVTRLLLDEPEVEVEQKEQKESENNKSKIKNYDLLEMRLYLCQYSNPLQAKIVLFSLAYHLFGDSEQDWSMLRTCTLEDLILKVFDCYGSVYEIQEKLDYLKYSLKNSEAVAQTSTIIIQALTSFYETLNHY